MATDTAWTKTSGTAEGCAYQRYVPYSPSHCCTGDGDCAELGNTATPTAPAGGGAPPDCCGCTLECLVDPDPGCCGGSTPNQVEVTIMSAAEGPGCDFDTAPNFHVHKLDVSSLAGSTFTLPLAGGGGGNACVWEDTFEMKTKIKLLQCAAADASGGCAGCTPTTDITVSCMLTVRFVEGAGVGFPSCIMTGSDTELDNAPFPLLVGVDMVLNGDWVSCCEPTSYSSRGPGNPGDVWTEVFITSAVAVPC